MNDTPGRMLSSLTGGGGGGDKQQPKLGGCVGVFFQLFDWNRRITGKKLFSNRLLPAERTKKQVSKKYNDEKLPMAKLLLIADENRGGFPHAKKSCGSVCSSTEDPCCSSSEDGNANGMRAPGVVARLMGLESLPANDLPDSAKEYQTKSSEPRPLPELLNQRKHADFFYEGQVDQPATKKPNAKPNGPAKKPVETRPWKLQKTGLFEKRPISRFQTDTLPAKSILSPSKAHGKLVSPSKSPGILSAKNAARLIEAAAKILEPGMQTSNKAKNPLIRSSVARPLLKYQEGDDKNTYTKRSSRLSEAQNKNGGSNTIKSLKGQVLSKSWNGNEDTDGSRSNVEPSSSTFASSAQEQCGTSVQDIGKRKSKVPIASIRQEGSGTTTRAQSKLETSKVTHPKQQEKTISLALEAKANVQRREIEPAAASSNRTHSFRDKNYFKHFQDESKQQQSEQQDGGHKPQQKQSVYGITRAPKQTPSAPNDRQSNRLLSQEKGVLKTNRVHQKTSKAFAGESLPKSIQRNPLAAKDFVASNRNVSAHQRNNTCNRVSGLRKDGCKDRECRKKSEGKKGDSSVESKALSRKKRASDGHVPRENTCLLESASVDECKVFSGKNEKKGCSKSVEEVVSNGQENAAIQNKQECLKIAEKYGEGNQWSQWDNKNDSQSCSKSIDVVSFTFSSPMRSTGGSQTGIHVTEKRQGSAHVLDDWRERQNARWRDPPLDCEPEKIISEVTCASPSSFKSTVSGGDSLNALLECKLRELASAGGVDLGTGGSSKDSISGKTTAASILQDLILALNTGRPQQMAQKMSTGHNHSEKAGKADLTSECSLEFRQTVGENKKMEAGGFSGSGYVPSRGRNVRTVVGDSGGPVCAEDCDQPSPVSILEASFSNESSNSSESLDGAHDDKVQLLDSLVQNRADCVHPADGHQGLDGSAELSDSASSANMELVESDKIMGAILNISRMHRIDPSLIGLAETQPACLEDQELEYVREIVCNAKLMSEDVALLNEADAADALLDPNLFHRLEAQGSSTDDYSLHVLKKNCYSSAFRKAQGSWQSRKLLFDCVKEYVNSKYGSLYRRGYIAWAKGSTCVVRERLAREVYEEIVRWRNLAFGMLDEIVEKDMSTPMGKWTDFEVEMFEIGVEIEKNIFQVLVEEVAYDLLPDTAYMQIRNGLAVTAFC